ncbi:MAG: hypothetical protein ABIQ90_14675 [Polaromonas sp.]
MHLPKTPMIVASLVAASFALGSGAAFGQKLSNVANANTRIPGVTVPTVLSPELAQIVRAQGSMLVENPTGLVKYYGYLNDKPNLLPASNSNVEASKTEPDKNTYLVLPGLKGADPQFNYGTHFLFQGHEAGAPGAITRINLDADAAHRVTVLATAEAGGAALPTLDGSTWYPWSGRLLMTAEGNGSTTGGVWQATPDFPAVAENLLGVFGRGGYEGIQADSHGNIWLVEDIGGATVAGARLPNSFIFRFIPKHARDLKQGGKLQALQVMSKATPGQPIIFQTASALTQDIKDLHSYGVVFDTHWVTVHDTDVDGVAVFDANALAKARNATPFKRPENGQFRPGSNFSEFFFDETGDTNATTTAAPDHGGFGSVMKLSQSSPSADSGKLSLFFKGDPEHTGFDNVAFWDANRVVFVEDRGDTLHGQGNGVQATALDSGWLFDARKNYADAANRPVRIMAEGRDPSATIDSALQGTAGFQNDGDNEITGFHVSDGSPGTDGLLGAKIPRPFKEGWRVFYSQQHGDNGAYELVRDKRHGGRDDDGDQ